MPALWKVNGLPQVPQCCSTADKCQPRSRLLAAGNGDGLQADCCSLCSSKAFMHQAGLCSFSRVGYFVAFSDRTFAEKGFKRAALYTLGFSLQALPSSRLSQAMHGGHGSV